MILDAKGNPISTPERRPRVARRAMRATYDVAQTNKNNERHWLAADALSADAANKPAVRKTIRQRARYEHANNCYVTGMVNFAATDTIGSQIRLQMARGETHPRRGMRWMTRDEARLG